MPLIIQGQVQAVSGITINDLSSEVIQKCENRTTDVVRSYYWLRDAILEISANSEYRNDFDELENYGVPFSLTSKVQEYPFNNFLNAGDYNLGTLDFLIWTDYPTNVVRRRLDMTSYQDADTVSPNTYSTPTEWYRFGDTVGFVLPPDKPYQVQARILKQHPINDQALQTTQILLPRDWHEILVWSAVEKGFAELLEYEKAKNVHDMLFGDPKHPEKPGLIASRKKRRERENWRAQKALQPVVRRYSY